jgi:hypothetical protein
MVLIFFIIFSYLVLSKRLFIGLSQKLISRGVYYCGVKDTLKKCMAFLEPMHKQGHM